MGALIDPAGILLDRDPAPRPFGDAEARRGEPRRWDFLGNFPVPLRQRIRDGVADLVAESRAAGGPPLKCCFPMGQGGPGPFDRLRFIRALDDYPDMLVSAENGAAFNRRFHERFVAAGAFSGCQPARAASVFEACGLIDPKGWIGASRSRPSCS
jgi:hypothetical protein